MNKKRHINYQDELMELLQDRKEAVSYLNAALADEDQRVFLLALKDVLAAQGGDISALAQETELNRENLYRILSARGNPKLANLRSVLNVLGFELAVQPFRK